MCDRRGSPKEAAVRPQRSGPTKLSYKDQRTLDRLPGEIERLTETIAALESELADPDLYARSPDRVDAAGRDLAARRAELDAAEELWLELAQRQEDFAR